MLSLGQNLVVLGDYSEFKSFRKLEFVFLLFGGVVIELLVVHQLLQVDCVRHGDWDAGKCLEVEIGKISPHLVSSEGGRQKVKPVKHV